MKIQVLIICSGLGYVKRGFESFTQECYEVLSKCPEIDITLLKGGGKRQEKEISVWNLPRHSLIVQQLTRHTGFCSYSIEQISFFLGMIPYIYSLEPNLIYFSDPTLGNLLWYWKKITRQTYKLLFSNGGPTPLEHFPGCDYIQQVAPNHLSVALKGGIPAKKQSLVPYGIYINPQLDILSSFEKESLRHKLGLPRKNPIVLSVGLINKSRKRMDYIIQEVSSLPEPRPYLLLLGQQDVESPEIIRFGNEVLGKENFEVRTVAQNEIGDYYKIADIFVLASLFEGLARVFLEAMSYGLPCLVHDYDVTRFVFDNKGYFGNFQQTGSLAYLIKDILKNNLNNNERYQIHKFVYDRFSWTNLKQNYLELIQKCINC